MMHKAWSSREEVPYYFSRSSVKFQGHKWQKLPILTRIECFRTVTAVWIHRWLWNDAQGLMQYRRGALLFFEVINQIWRSHGLKNRRFESNFSKITRPVAAIKSFQICLVYYCSYYTSLIIGIQSLSWIRNPTPHYNPHWDAITHPQTTSPFCHKYSH